MNDFSPWLQSDWYALGSLLIRLGFLIVGVWFARNFLRAIRSFHEQLGALVKLSIADAPVERSSASTIAARSLEEASPYWLPPAGTQTSASVPSLLEPAEKRPNGLVVAWHSLICWLNEPMKTSKLSAWRRMINWLQAPAGS